MKWLFYFLLAVNAAYFTWQVRHLEPPHAPDEYSVPLPGYVTRLLLLKEVGTTQLRERAKSPRPVAVAAPPEPKPESQVQNALAVADVGDEVLTERAVADGPLCLSVGPLPEDAGAAGEVAAWLRVRGGESVLREGERRELARYWIYFPPFGSLDEAIARRDQMQAQGIDDLQVIPRGDMANAISLGVYNRRSSLERRLNQLRSRGYEPEILPRYRTTTASWFDVAFAAAGDFPAEQFAASFPDLEATRTVCAAN